MPYDQDNMPPEPDPPLDYTKPDILGAPMDCYKVAAMLAVDIITATHETNIAPARLPDLLRALGPVLDAYDRGDQDAVMAGLDLIVRNAGAA